MAMVATLAADVRAAADAALTDLAAALRQRQAGVLGPAGRYRQVRRQDAWDTWDAVKPASPAEMTACWIDEYVGPQGAGYVLGMDVRDPASGVLWRRRVNVGPERHQNAAWHAVVVEE